MLSIDTDRTSRMVKNCFGHIALQEMDSDLIAITQQVTQLIAGQHLPANLLSLVYVGL